MKLALAAAVFLLLAPFAPAARAQDAAAKSEAPKKAPAKRKKKASARANKKKVPESKYKSRALSENVDERYRFDEDGNPVDKKKPAKARKKSSSSGNAGRPACSSDEPCSDPKTSSDADAL